MKNENVSHKRSSLLVVGLTGNIGAGKTTVARVLACKGIPSYDADIAAKRILSNNKDLHAYITKAWGSGFFSNSGLPLFKRIGQYIFAHADERHALESQIHPCIAKDFAVWLEKQKAVYVLLDAALLFEVNWHTHVDKVVVVIAPEALRMHRIKQRDKRQEDEIKNIMATQMRAKEQAARADYVIYNNERDSVLAQTDDVHKHIMALSKAR